MKMKYILASGSPRRKELLEFIISDYSCITANVDETCPTDIEPQNRPEYLALLKAREVAKNYKEDVVIGADTAVFSGQKMLGKPKNEKEAFNMLKSLSGKTHSVITGCAVVFGDRHISFSCKTDVEFFSLSDREINNYISSKEPMDKAGAYGIQGLGSLLVKGINGDYFNVVGLPVSLLNKKLKEFLD